ncbi:hypothetical protein AALO_G00132640, partial [Alosa alosa]
MHTCTHTHEKARAHTHTLQDCEYTCRRTHTRIIADTSARLQRGVCVCVCVCVGRG